MIAVFKHRSNTDPKMKQLTNREAILSIETAIGSGSLSLLANSREVDGWSGMSEISKAENILEQISKLLRVNKIEKKNVRLICVSSGTGSSTGEKIGWAIGKGLAKAFGCPLLGISILESLLLEIENESDGEYITALHCGRNFICWQKFIKREVNFHSISAVEVSEAGEFFMLSESFGCKKIVVAISAADNIRHLFKAADKNLFIDNKCTLANLNGRVAFRSLASLASDNVNGFYGV